MRSLFGACYLIAHRGGGLRFTEGGVLRAPSPMRLICHSERSKESPMAMHSNRRILQLASVAQDDTVFGGVRSRAGFPARSRPLGFTEEITY